MIDLFGNPIEYKNTDTIEDEYSEVEIENPNQQRLLLDSIDTDSTTPTQGNKIEQFRTAEGIQKVKLAREIKALPPTDKLNMLKELKKQTETNEQTTETRATKPQDIKKILELDIVYSQNGNPLIIEKIIDKYYIFREQGITGASLIEIKDMEEVILTDENALTIVFKNNVTRKYDKNTTSKDRAEIRETEKYKKDISRIAKRLSKASPILSSQKQLVGVDRNIKILAFFKKIKSKFPYSFSLSELDEISGMPDTDLARGALVANVANKVRINGQDRERGMKKTLTAGGFYYYDLMDLESGAIHKTLEQETKRKETIENKLQRQKEKANQNKAELKSSGYIDKETDTDSITTNEIEQFKQATGIDKVLLAKKIKKQPQKIKYTYLVSYIEEQWEKREYINGNLEDVEEHEFESIVEALDTYEEKISKLKDEESVFSSVMLETRVYLWNEDLKDYEIIDDEDYEKYHIPKENIVEKYKQIEEADLEQYVYEDDTNQYSLLTKEDLEEINDYNSNRGAFEIIVDRIANLYSIKVSLENVYVATTGSRYEDLVINDDTVLKVRHGDHSNNPNNGRVDIHMNKDDYLLNSLDKTSLEIRDIILATIRKQNTNDVGIKKSEIAKIVWEQTGVLRDISKELNDLGLLNVYSNKWNGKVYKDVIYIGEEKKQVSQLFIKNAHAIRSKSITSITNLDFSSDVKNNIIYCKDSPFTIEATTEKVKEIYKENDLPTETEEFKQEVVDTIICRMQTALETLLKGELGISTNEEKEKKTKEILKFIAQDKLIDTDSVSSKPKEVAVIFVQDSETGKYLLGQRRDSGRWTTPAGGYERRDATIYATAKRELQEETNIELEFSRFRKIATRHIKADNVNATIFKVSINPEKYKISNKFDKDREFSRILWYNTKQLKKLPLHHKEDLLHRYLFGGGL